MDDFDSGYITSDGRVIMNHRRSQVPKHARPTGYGDEVYWHDEDGFVRHYPTRTKYSHPYSYDPITLFGCNIDRNDRSVEAVYSDRMQQWDYKKFDESLKVACGQTGELRFSWGSKSKVTKLMQHYIGDTSVEVIKVVEMCNASSGYPLWLIYYRNVLRLARNDDDRTIDG